MKRLLLLLVAASAITGQACKKPAETAAGSAPTVAAAAPPPAALPAPPTGPAGGPPAPPPGVPVRHPPPSRCRRRFPTCWPSVNGEAIERWEFENAVKRMESRAGGPVPPDRRDEVLRNVLDQLVAYHLLAQESRRRKIEVTQAEIDARMAQIRQSFPSEEAFTQGVAAQGLTVDQVKQQTRTGIEVAKVIEAEVGSEDCRHRRRRRDVLQDQYRALQAGRQRAREPYPDRGAGAGSARGESRGQSQGGGMLKQLKAGADFATWRKQSRRIRGAPRTAATSDFSRRVR